MSRLVAIEMTLEKGERLQGKARYSGSVKIAWIRSDPVGLSQTQANRKLREIGEIGSIFIFPRIGPIYSDFRRFSATYRAFLAGKSARSH